MFYNCPFVRSFVGLLANFERDILKTNFDANWHKWSVGQGHETVNFGVIRSKVKVTGGQR